MKKPANGSIQTSQFKLAFPSQRRTETTITSSKISEKKTFSQEAALPLPKRNNIKDNARAHEEALVLPNGRNGRSYGNKCKHISALDQERSEGDMGPSPNLSGSLRLISKDHAC
ncbi:hypothetical protein ABEB36_010235 [Hypothenemus hampei]|uniref:Exophilin 5 n=1 Tax=Hypothenemus hampei TaxID=57062 RepID=A0ABD1EIY6_HYPHA